MSLTVTNNTLAQQQAIQSQLAAAQTSAVSTTSSSDSTAGTSSTSASSPATALISGNATLTSDLLSVLLNEQSGSATSGSSGVTTLAGLLDNQDAATAQQDGTAQPNLFSDLYATQTQTSGTSSEPSLVNDLESASLTQSANSTGSVVDGLQSLLQQLAV